MNVDASLETADAPEDLFRGDVARRLLTASKPGKGVESVRFAIEAHEALIQFAGC